MGNKISYALKKCKSVFIIAIILWLVIDIVLIAPIAVSIASATNDGKVSMEIFFDNFFKELTSFTSIFRVFNSAYNSNFWESHVMDDFNSWNMYNDRNDKVKT